jgi:hypothetical protein
VRLRLVLDQPDPLDEQASPSLEELIFRLAVGDAGILNAVAKAPESGPSRFTYVLRSLHR